MKIHLTASDLLPKAKSPAHLPGERHPFVERTVRNLVPPQHLEGNTVVSSREHEVSCTDPLMLRIKELVAENDKLRMQRDNLQARLDALQLEYEPDSDCLFSPGDV